MEVIITGATGYVGTHVLRCCVKDASIHKIHVLSRRAFDVAELLPDLPQATGKVSVVIQQDWLRYDKNKLDALKSASACIWCIGGRHTQKTQWEPPESYLEMTVDYTLAAASAFAEACASSTNKFRFIYVSGHASEINHHASLYVMGPTRRAKGCAERGLFALADAQPDKFESITVRPCGIYPARPTLTTLLMTHIVLPHTIQVTQLAMATLHLAKNGADGRDRIVSCYDAETIGQAALDALAVA